MSELNTTADTIVMVLIVAAAGVVGGLVGELLIFRGARKESGAFEIPGKRGTRFFDLGSLAALPIGIVAALIALVLFSPIEEVIEEGATVREYDLIRVIGLGLVAGLAGPAFLLVVQERFTALVTTERMEAALDMAKKALEKAPGAIGEEDAKDAARSAKPEMELMVLEAQNQTSPAFYRQLEACDALGPNNEVLLGGTRAGTIRLAPPVDQSVVLANAESVADGIAQTVAVSLQRKVSDHVKLAREMIDAAVQGQTPRSESAEFGERRPPPT
jgi:hypothetical protein